MKLTELEIENLAEKEANQGPNREALLALGVDIKTLYKEGLTKALELEDPSKIALYSLGFSAGRALLK